MDRGPLALFGAIIAVGVGPALWLGAQLGTADLAPGQRPAPVDEQFPGVDMDFGGAGAGDMPADEPLITYTFAPLASESSVPPQPSASASSVPVERATTRVSSSPVRPVPPSPPPPSTPASEVPSVEPPVESSASVFPEPSVEPSIPVDPSPTSSPSPTASSSQEKSLVRP